MRYRLRTLLILLAVGPVLLWRGYWLCVRLMTPRAAQNDLRDASIRLLTASNKLKKASADFSEPTK
jgi:hypothetical protein